MSLTVRRLIAELKKMPANAKVAVCAHDQSPDHGEFDGSPLAVYRAPDAIRDRGMEVVICLG